jgi:predicted RNA-binding protein YlxR (DUF448 family)
MDVVLHRLQKTKAAIHCGLSRGNPKRGSYYDTTIELTKKAKRKPRFDQAMQRKGN